MGLALGVIRYGVQILLFIGVTLGYGVTFEGPLALEGYDVVAYFEVLRPERGIVDHKVFYKDRTYYFASKARAKKFKQDPEKYLPKYDGHDAFAIARGGVVRGNPKYWAIVRGHLYLAFNKTVLDKWIKDGKRMIREGDMNWVRLRSDLEKIK